MENKCLICYEHLEDGQIDYHPKCMQDFFNKSDTPTLAFGLDKIEKLAQESINRSITITGVQPKLSLGWIKHKLEKSNNRLTILNAMDGSYILKPPTKEYEQLPENEHLSMKLAELFKINTVPHSMIRLKTGELCYITKRIDRKDNSSKCHLIDFQQIFGTDDKYKGTMEKLGDKLGVLSTNILYDKYRLFELTIFNFVIGNNDMHLKNFSMFLSKNGWILSPAYDLLNVKLALPSEKDDLALLLSGKNKKFQKHHFNEYGERLGLNSKQIQEIYKRLHNWLPEALSLIDKSFLKATLKEQYQQQIIEQVHFF